MIIGTGSICAEEVIATLEKEQTLILATCSDKRVTIRPMSHINIALDIYFQTSKDALKIKQIQANKYVALAVGTYEVEGIAHICGHPLQEENGFFAQSYQLKHPNSFKAYSFLEEEVVVHVKVLRVRQWRYDQGKPILAESEF